MKIKAHDTAITFSDTLTLDGAAVDLTAATVNFIMELSGAVFSDAATIVSATAGTVSYLPGIGFPTTLGTYRQEWEVTFPDATKLTFPGDSYNKITIMADLNAA